MLRFCCSQYPLCTGRTICKLHLAPGTLHADVNGDGVVDHVQVGRAGCGEVLGRAGFGEVDTGRWMKEGVWGVGPRVNEQRTDGKTDTCGRRGDQMARSWSERHLSDGQKLRAGTNQRGPNLPLLLPWSSCVTVAVDHATQLLWARRFHTVSHFIACCLPEQVYHGSTMEGDDTDMDGNSHHPGSHCMATVRSGIPPR